MDARRAGADKLLKGQVPFLDALVELLDRA